MSIVVGVAKLHKAKPNAICHSHYNTSVIYPKFHDQPCYHRLIPYSHTLAYLQVQEHTAFPVMSFWYTIIDYFDNQRTHPQASKQVARLVEPLPSLTSCEVETANRENVVLSQVCITSVKLHVRTYLPPLNSHW